METTANVADYTAEPLTSADQQKATGVQSPLPILARERRPAFAEPTGVVRTRNRLPWGKRINDLFEAGIAAERIPKRQQLEISIAKRSWNVSGRGKLFKREILLANPGRADGKPLNHQRTIKCIFLHRQKLDRAATFA